MKAVAKDIPPGAALSRYDAADYLQTPEARAAYLEVVFEEYGDDPRMVAKALGDVARALGMQRIRKRSLSGPPEEDAFAALAQETALGRLATADEVAKATLFLASDLASGISGELLPVDAGLP